MNTIEQHKTLVSELYKLTNEKKLLWIVGSNGEPYVSFDDYYVNLKQRKNASGSTMYEIYIEDNDLKELDRFNDEDLDGEISGAFYKIMEELYKSAKRQGTGSDKAVEEILAKLKGL